MRIRGPVPYDQFKQRVRRHRRTDVLHAVSALAARYAAATVNGEPPPSLPNVVGTFSLAGVARAAILYGNEHRTSGVSVDDLIQMCALYVNVHEPALGEDPGGIRLRGLMHRIAYEQFGHQVSEMENIGRTLLLFDDHAGSTPNAPQPADWEALLGTSLLTFMEIGFAMHVAALHNGGGIAMNVLRLDHVAPIFTPLSVDDALNVVDRWYSATIEELKTTGQRVEATGFEKWSLNPLQVRPIVRFEDRYLMPCPRWVIDRFTPTGLYFIGLEAWGSRFTDALGDMFESYVGSQLQLLDTATVYPEIVYGPNGEKTVDYFVVTSDAVILVEAKSARPVYATRLGQPESDQDISKKVGKAVRQINNTAQLLRDGDPAVAHINPSGLPVVGVVVTLEAFYLLNTFVHDLLDAAEIPTVISSSHELEGFISAVYDRADVGSWFLAAVSQPGPSPPSLHAALSGLPIRSNPLLDDAWARFHASFSALASTVEAEVGEA